MKRTNVKSSLIASLGWEETPQNPGMGTLEVEFPKKGGGSSVYQYANFPRNMWDEFQAAESKGKFFLSKVKAKFAYVKVEQPKEEDPAAATV